MYHSSQIHKYAKEYVTKELRNCDIAIANHLKGIRKAYAMIKIFETKTEPNIKGLILAKHEDIARREKRINFYRGKIEVIKLIPIRRKTTFMAILKILNANIIKEVLKGGKYVFPLNIGKLYILVGDKHYGLNTINWHRSMQIINGIAERTVPEIFNQYKSGELKQFEYIQLMKPHLHPTPGKPRWKIIGDDTHSWWIVLKRGSYSNKNKYYFKFKSTYYIELKDKSINKLGKYFSSPESVIQSTKLGFMNKVLVLKQFFNEHKLQYNDISSDKW